MSDIHVGYQGLVLKPRFTDDGAVVDISAATGRTIRLRDPDGTTSDKTATFTTDGTDGYIQYTTDADDLNKAGKWQAQAIVTGPSLNIPTKKFSFVVKPNLATP